MTTEAELRKALSEFGIGFELLSLKSHDRINLYPTRSKGVHKMTLEMRRRIDDIELTDMMKYCLSKADYQLFLKSHQTKLPDPPVG